MSNRNDCKDRREAIAALVLGELESSAADEIKRHIDICPSCRSLYQALTAEEQTIRSTFEAIEDRSRVIEDELVARIDRDSHESSSGPTILRRIWGGSKTNWRIGQLAAAAAIAIIVLGGVTFWPPPNQKGSEWWLGPPAAWGQEITAELKKVAALTYRQRAIRVRDYGPDTIGGLWDKSYAAKNKYRREVRDEADKIIQIQWTVPEGEGFMKYQVWPEHRCYTQKPEKYPPGYDNVMSWLHRWVRLLHKANRVLGTQSLQGRECVGFEISPGTYEGFLVGEPTYVWLDVKTKLPVQVERRGIPVDYDPGMTLTLIHDQFDYYAQVPADMFTVRIPEGFVNADPEELAAKKGRMVYADVPAELRDKIVAALRQVKTAVYQEHSEITVEGDLTVYPADKIYLSPDGWRRDDYLWRDQLHKTEWYAIEKEDRPETNADFKEDNFKLIHTTVNFSDETYSVATYTKDEGPRHPIDRILFRAGYVNQADRMLEDAKIEGIECFGVQISAKKFGNNPDSDKHRLWFSAETKLPVRIEFEWWQDNQTKKSVRVLDNFDWNPELPDDTFTPKIPEGFTLVSTAVR